MKRILKFLIAFLKFIFFGSPVTPDVYEKRINTCNNCRFKENERCTICTCYVKKKAKWSTEDCPKNKW